ncbi:uncharacterized protein LOC125051095 [Pieris napi]|uniref:uncharacterized protein LOC125051095 n=1 Tax=Pieris napi TaxID=78633 RepID=UPI001FB9D6F7|nr:uncharacterized protein LOC125051095 [Pieris napi]
MAEHTPFINRHLFICIAVSLLLPIVDEAKVYEDGRFQNEEKRLTREYHLRQGAVRGLIVKPGRQYDLQPVEMFLGVPYAAPPTGSFRFMPPVSAPPWSGLKMATRFAPVCPQILPQIRKGNPPSLGRQHYLNRLKPFLKEESEDCLYLNIYVPYREQKAKKFPVLVFIHGDSFEWSSGNPYDGRILASYGNIMVVTVNFRLGILGFMKPSLTEHAYGNNGLLDQLAALQWIKDNIEDLNGDPKSVTLMGHGTGAACVNFLMLSPISNGLFHRAILMSGSALSDRAMTKDPTQYTLQVAQSLGCKPSSKNMMTCLQNKPLSEIKKVQILSREFETPLGPAVAGSLIPSEPAQTMESFPNLLSKYQLLSGVTELESYHDFGVIQLDHGILENQRDDFIRKYTKIVYEGAEDIALKEILLQYSTSKVDPQRWSVQTNRDVVLNLFSDARTLGPIISLANYQSKANRQSYFYVFAHNSVSTEYAPLNKSVHGEELPYVLGVPLGGANTHFHSEYTLREKLLSEVVMRLWTNFVKNGSPNTQSVNEYQTLDRKVWNQYNVEWPEYNLDHQPYLKLDIPPSVNSLYRSNYTRFWIESLPKKLSRYVIDPLYAFTPSTTVRPKPPPIHKSPLDTVRKIWSPQPVINTNHYSMGSYGKLRPYSQPEHKPDTDAIYREIQSIKTPSRPVPPHLMEKHTEKPILNTAKTSSTTVTLIIALAVLFLAVNVSICALLYFKKRRLRLQALERPSEIGEVDIIGQKSSDKSALQKLKNGCSVIKSIKIPKKKINKECKTPKSDDSGGFRERFQLRRHLSTSTLDAHTKVRDWITNEVMHRCSPNILRKSNSDVNNTAKQFTRSEELLTDKKIKTDKIAVTPTNLLSKNYKKRTSEKTTSTSALDSHSSIVSNNKSHSKTSKSNDSIKSQTDSMRSKKVSVAIDATPSARTNSILNQEPIEISRSFDCIDKGVQGAEHKLQRSQTVADDTYSRVVKPLKTSTDVQKDEKTYKNEIKLSLQNPNLKISHKHSTSDPVTDVNYEQLMKQLQGEAMNILPPVTFRNEINVTSRDDMQAQPLSPEEALLTIKRRNFPKVLPDLPKSQKRLSLQPTLQSFRGINSQIEKLRVPPQPPPRTTTLDRRLAYKNTKVLSSFDSPRKNIYGPNYENIDNLSPCSEISKSKSFENRTDLKPLNKEKDLNTFLTHRDYPKVIIASSDISPEPKIIIKPSLSQIEIPSNVPRVRLPDDFHSGSITSFSSYCSDDDEEVDDIEEDEFEDKLIQELVGRVESPSEDVLDSKGPATVLKRMEIVPVKLNTVQTQNSSDYVCVSDLHLPDISHLEQTAQIKPNFRLNKLKNRSESISRPPEKAIKVKQKKPGVILHRVKSRSKCDSKLEHSTSGSSNDTETSTGTVKKADPK